MKRREFEKPSEEELEMRKQMYSEAEALGIDLMGFDGDDNDEEYRSDVRKAVVLLGTGKPIPEDLRQRLLERKAALIPEK